MKVATTVAIACLSCVVLAGTSQDVSLLRLERSVYVMGTRATLVVFTPVSYTHLTLPTTPYV